MMRVEDAAARVVESISASASFKKIATSAEVSTIIFLLRQSSLAVAEYFVWETRIEIGECLATCGNFQDDVTGDGGCVWRFQAEQLRFQGAYDHIGDGAADLLCELVCELLGFGVCNYQGHKHTIRDAVLLFNPSLIWNGLYRHGWLKTRDCGTQKSITKKYPPLFHP